MDKDDPKVISFNKYLDSLPEEKLREESEKDLVQAEKDFKKLKEALEKGQCSLCSYPISHFSERKPCLHWFLKPKGFKKRHLPLIYAENGFHRIQAYLRWVANSEKTMRNINDLTVEKSESKIIEETIKYKNLEWSFSCGKNDFSGHPDKHEGKEPHYHFQMKVDDLVIINFNSFHLPFDEEDEFYFAMKDGTFNRVAYKHVQGAGMQDFFDQVKLEELIEHMKNADNAPENAQFRTQTIVMADEGKTISSEEIEELMKEREKTGTTFAKLAKRLKNVKVITTVEPGPEIPEISKRRSR